MFINHTVHAYNNMHAAGCAGGNVGSLSYVSCSSHAAAGSYRVRDTEVALPQQLLLLLPAPAVGLRRLR